MLRTDPFAPQELQDTVQTIAAKLGKLTNWQSLHDAIEFGLKMNAQLGSIRAEIEYRYDTKTHDSRPHSTVSSRRAEYRPSNIRSTADKRQHGRNGRGNLWR